MKIFVLAAAAATLAAVAQALVDSPAMRRVDTNSRSLQRVDPNYPCSPGNNWCGWKPPRIGPTEPTAAVNTPEAATRSLQRVDPNYPCSPGNNWCGWKPPRIGPTEPVVVAAAPAPSFSA